MKPYNSGYLKVSEKDEIYFECKGNEQAFPILFLHGGPGSSFSDTDEKFFDLEIQNVIFFDQRRSGKSQFDFSEEKRPEEIIDGLDMTAMIEDILTFLDFLGIKKVDIFGGSWGSTLGLVFAIQYPDRVQKMILRGIYLAGVFPDEEFLYGNGSDFFYPEVWESFLEKVPEKHRKSQVTIFDYILEEVKSGDYELLLELGNSEGCMMNLSWEKNFSEEIDDSFENIVGCLVEFWFIKNACFLPNNYILDNSSQLKNKEIHIIQGRYDCVCPAIDAWKLHKKLAKSTLQFVVGGHSSSEPEILKALQKAVKKVYN